MVSRSGVESSRRPALFRGSLFQGSGWPSLFDTLISLVLIAGLWLMVAPDSSALRAVQLSLAGALVLGFVLRRWFPRAATIIVLLATTTGWWLGVTGDPFLIAGFCLFVAAERFGARRVPWWLASTAAFLLASVLFVAAEGLENSFLAAIIGAVVLGAAWMLGVRTRQMREETARRVQAQERLRLSRDVHDVLSHALGTIGVRAGVLAHVESTTQELREAMREIEGDSRAALGDLRSLLSRERAGVSDQPPAAAQLGVLIADAARATEAVGVRVRTEVDEAAEAAPASVRTTAYRIVQESVTNVIRHAHASVCTISVRVEGRRLVVEVSDDGHGSRSEVPAGHGLAGMRERVALLGGTLEAGNTPDAGLMVRAVLPVEPVSEGAL